MIVIRYTTRAGQERVYRYPHLQQPARERCHRVLKRAGRLEREGRYWRAPDGKRFYPVTIGQLVAAGRARIEGNTVVPA